MKIAVLEEQTVTSGGEVSFDEIRSLGETVCYPLTPQDKVVQNVCDCGAAIINKTVFTREVMEQCPNLKYIGLCATGYNNVDIKAAAELGITVCNCPAYSTDAVAQQVFSYILHFMNRVSEYDSDVHNGGWINSPTFSYFTFPTYELKGMTLGIIGFGSIGSRVAEIARVFGMDILAYSRTPKNADSVEFVPLEDIFRRSDIITLHCPLTADTEGLINIDNLKLCKPSAIVINTSRGPVVNEKDLAYALRNNIIAGAAVDVISSEPMKKDNPLINAPNCVITPHVAWAPVQTRQRLMKIAADNLRAFINGTPQNKVN
ncbi:MAG: D-2-hydroxyacid dehydrogenase [Oscillospiraceae bacterium]|nr:D-2-hydroxyacid dehydrogenase [Oscillospiraceae bacterium]